MPRRIDNRELQVVYTYEAFPIVRSSLQEIVVTVAPSSSLQEALRIATQLAVHRKELHLFLLPVTYGAFRALRNNMRNLTFTRRELSLIVRALADQLEAPEEPLPDANDIPHSMAVRSLVRQAKNRAQSKGRHISVVEDLVVQLLSNRLIKGVLRRCEVPPDLIKRVHESCKSYEGPSKPRKAYPHKKRHRRKQFRGSHART